MHNYVVAILVLRFTHTTLDEYIFILPFDMALFLSNRTLRAEHIHEISSPTSQTLFHGLSLANFFLAKLSSCLVSLVTQYLQVKGNNSPFHRAGSQYLWH